MNLDDLDVEPGYDPASPLAFLEKAAAADGSDRTRLAVTAVRALLAAAPDAGVLAEARACVKRHHLLIADDFNRLVREYQAASGDRPGSRGA